MRKDPEAIRQWSPRLVLDCALMQQNIVHHAFEALRPGGYLIYSTCSYSPRENIENVSGFIKNLNVKTVPLSFPDQWGIVETNFENAKGYQLFPHRIEGEGLFIAVLQKEHNDPGYTFKKPKDQFTSLPGWLNDHIRHPKKMGC